MGEYWREGRQSMRRKRERSKDEHQINLEGKSHLTCIVCSLQRPFAQIKISPFHPESCFFKFELR